MGKPSTSANLVKGTRGNDVLRVTQRTDQDWTVDGGAGNDTLYGANGADTLLGGGGDDTIFGMPNDARLDGGTGYDTLDLSLGSGPVRYLGSFGQLTYWPDSTPDSYTKVSGFEKVVGSNHADYLFGSWFAETLQGGGGADHIDGGRGDDVLTGGGGADYFEFSHDGGGVDQVTDFVVGEDRLFFYGVPQPGTQAVRVQGSDLIVDWANGSVILLGMGQLSPAQYGTLFALTNGDITVGG